MDPVAGQDSLAISYPQQEALTRRFRLGQPRAYTVAPDGSRVVFIRSAGGRDPRGSLWVAEPDGSGGLIERCVVDALTLGDETAELPAEERARRERMRETTTGITAYSTDSAVTRAAFSIDGALMAVELTDPAARPMVLPAPSGVIDPRLSPDGRTVAFVASRSLFAVPSDGSAESICLAAADSPSQAWGLADFIAAEELERIRGLWWFADSSALLVEHSDESDVPVHWIADPASPESEPVAHRYPRAGTTNPRVALFVVGLNGVLHEIPWDHDAYPYLATVHPDPEGDEAVVSVLSRDQSRQLILAVTSTAEVTPIRERVTEPWITMQAGVPRRDGRGRLIEITADSPTDTFRLVRDDTAITPSGLQVTGLAQATGDVVFTAQENPCDQGVYSVDEDGLIEPIMREPGIHAVVSGRGGNVLISSSPDRPGSTIRVSLGGSVGAIASLAERPVVEPRPRWHRVTERSLACAVLLPTGHQPGSRRLPVVMAPYGGPHHARVVHAAGAYAADQWLADQGFAVVVVDGAGTPGRGPAFEFEVHGDLAAGVLQDQVDALQALGEVYPDLDLDRVGITGWSFGGYLAALAVLDRPDVFHAAVAGAPVTEWALYDTAYTERYLGLPQDESEAYRRSSLLDRAAALQRPLLIIHGLADDNVLAAHTLQLSSALLAAGRPHSVIPLSGVTHMTPQEVVAENLLRLEVDFLRTHLGA
jgi:dipeptidyl-peptidase 4